MKKEFHCIRTCTRNGVLVMQDKTSYFFFNELEFLHALMNWNMSGQLGTEIKWTFSPIDAP